uniref:Uncharacterized protein n=1 Tax=Candidatus Kentrum sp. SD TaxID=2126332 RepID=A0A450YJD8_9GAMM|nr:MAG: hypothetical protein BECKSD772F_GA0070984_10981 [Candidatus Kentron sp. SD]VFK47047.1 MAG: hypothetical protein BECKSD772E_GA0070983_10872 [Candidatus Kentron sp. SD]
MALIEMQSTHEVINCEGRRIIPTNSMLSSGCAVIDTNIFLGSLGKHSVDSLCALGKPPPINIVIPSCCSCIGKTKIPRD